MGLAKNLNANLFFFNEAIRSKVSATTETVDTIAQDIGKYIIPITKDNTKIGDIFSKNCSIDLIFCNPIKSKHPDAISQNLVGIRKYAAD